MIKIKRISLYVILTTLMIIVSLSGYSQTVNIDSPNTLRKWDKVTVSLTLPSNISETNTSFKNNRMDVIFTDNSGNNYRVPGFFAADGNAANSNATSGKVFKAYLRPNKTGNWTYRVLYYTGTDVALQNINQLPSPTHNITGSIGNVSNTNASLPDLRAKGRLQYQTSGTNNQRRYLKWSETGDYFLKFGPDSPENLLDYDEFDHDVSKKDCALCTEHYFNPHASDWNNGDPTWDGGKGKNLIGAVNYLKNQQMNSMSMSLFGGDDKNVFPWTEPSNKYKYDVSKLEQWEIVLDHAEKNGLVLHLKLAEAENWNALSFNEIKVYYREMVARFGHHLGLEWNISEEFGSNQDINPALSIERINWLANIDPWQTHRVFHTYPGKHELHYNYLVNNGAKITGASIQSSQGSGYNDAYDGKSGIKTWINASKNAGKPWVVCSDEQNPGSNGMFTSRSISDTNVLPEARKKILWKGLLAGGAGVMWYGGAEGDFQTENFNRFNTMFEWSKIAILQFFEGNNLEYWKMQNNDALASGNVNRCLAQVGNTYVVYLENGGTTNLNLNGQTGTYSVKWFNPRSGGVLQNGSVTTISGGGNSALGNAPSNATSDWVILVKKTGGAVTPVTEINTTPATTSLEAGKTFALTASVLPNNATDKSISWTTNKGNIATVNSNGLITGISAGTATITATTNDGNFTDTTVVTVTAAPKPNLGCPFEEQNGLLVIEAESAQNYDDALFTLETGDVGTTSPTGAGYLRYNGPNHLGSQVAAHTISYKIKINTPGIYQFLWRNVRDPQAATADAANDAWLHIKDNGVRFYGRKGGNEYTLTKHTKLWVQKSDFVFECYGETNSGGSHINGMSIWADFPTAGEYTIEYGGRSKGHSVDRLMLFKTDQASAAKNTSTPESATTGTNCDGGGNNDNLTLNAVDFPTTQVPNFVKGYIDNARNAMAINAAQHKDVFAAVKQNFAGNSGSYDITLTTLAELDGESTYRLRVGGVLIGTYQNPTTTVDYTPTTKTWENVIVNNGDAIQVEFSSHTNGTIPEGDITAYSRGRWTKLDFNISEGDNNNPETIAFNNLPASFNNQTTTFPIEVTYSSNVSRDINVTLKDQANINIADTTLTVPAGNNKTVTVNINTTTPLANGIDYKLVTALRTIGGNYATNIDKQIDFIDIVTATVNDSVDLSGAPTNLQAQTSYSIDVAYTASDNRDLVVALYKANTWLKAGKVTVAPGSGTQTITVNLDTLPVSGTDYSWRSNIRPVGTNGSQATANDRVDNVTITAQTPFGGTAATIPGVVQAENYDEGGQGIAYNDTDPLTNHFGEYRTDGVDIETTSDTNGGSYNIGRMNASEWIEYTINVTTTQNYDFYPRVAAITDLAKLSIEIDGVNVSGTVDVPNTGGWQTFQNLAIRNINVTQGTHVIRINVVASGMNLSRWTAWPNANNPAITKFNNNADISFNGDSLNISLEKKSEQVQYSIYNSNGELLENGTANKSNFTITNSFITSGIYIVKIVTNEQQIVKKIVK